MAETEVARVVKSWLFDLHQMGRCLPLQTELAAQEAAVSVVRAGGTLSQAFDAARRTL